MNSVANEKSSCNTLAGELSGGNEKDTQSEMGALTDIRGNTMGQTQFLPSPLGPNSNVTASGDSRSIKTPLSSGPRKITANTYGALLCTRHF